MRLVSLVLSGSLLSVVTALTGCSGGGQPLGVQANLTELEAQAPRRVLDSAALAEGGGGPYAEEADGEADADAAAEDEGPSQPKARAGGSGGKVTQFLQRAKGDSGASAAAPTKASTPAAMPAAQPAPRKPAEPLPAEADIVGASGEGGEYGTTGDAAVSLQEQGSPEEPELGFRVKQGLYLGLFMPYVSVDGDMDGSTVYAGITEPGVAEGDRVPKVDPGLGFGVSLGYRWKVAALELNYQRTFHDMSYEIPLTRTDPALDVEGALNTVNIDGKFYPFPSWRVQPYGLIGLCFPILEAEKASVDSTGDVDDAIFFGFGGNFGIGVSVYPFPQWALFVEGGYRLAIFTSVSGAAGGGSLDDLLDCSGWFTAVGTSFTF